VPRPFVHEGVQRVRPAAGQSGIGNELLRHLRETAFPDLVLAAVHHSAASLSICRHENTQEAAMTHPLGTPARDRGADRKIDEDAALRPLLGVEEVAGILGVPKATLYRWHSTSTSDRIVGPPAFRVGRYLRYSLLDLASYIDHLRANAS
jgi:hypothetical protein